MNPLNKWIYIISSDLASMPEGMRVSPALKSHMPALITPNVAPVFQLAAGANHWRIAGLEITAHSNYPSGCGATGQPNCMTYFLMATPWPILEEPDSFTIDRCYIHGGPTQDLQQAVQNNWGHAAVIDSYIDDVHIKGLDSVGLGFGVTPGPIKVVNNYISASTENLYFGGSGGNQNPYVPSDIEVRNNYIYKPLSWVALSLAGQMVVKDGLEIKGGQRVLIDSNTIENVWKNGQEGYAIVLTVRTWGGGDLAVVDDITITNNVLKNVVSGFNTLAKDDGCQQPNVQTNCHNAGEQNRLNISNNLILFYDPLLPGGTKNYGIAFHQGADRINNVMGMPQNIIFQHNTMISAASTPCATGVYFGDSTSFPPAPHVTSNVWILDNVMCRQPSGDGGYNGTSGLTKYMGYPSTPPYDLTQRFYGNVMYVPSGDTVRTFPPHNYATTVPLTYVNPAAFNYQLLTPYWTDTSNGSIAGVNSSNLPSPY